MSPDEALQILDSAAAQARLTRDETAVVLNAGNTLRMFIATAHVPDPESEPGTPQATEVVSADPDALASAIDAAPKPRQNRAQRRRTPAKKTQ